jgi:hypothetical protein
MEMEDPSREYDRKDIQLPSMTKSRTDTDEPSRDIPYTETELPKRMNPRSDMAEPRLIKSSRLKLLPSRDIP